MKFNYDVLPYSYENELDPMTLPNGIVQQITWEYTVKSDSARIIERLRLKQTYQFQGYMVSARAIDEWHYTEHEPYENQIRGYRGFWDGMIAKDGMPVLQPEVAVLLCLTPDMQEVPPYIAITSQSYLVETLEYLRGFMSDHVALNAWRPTPVGGPPSTPADVSETITKMRSTIGLLNTRGRVNVLEEMMAIVGAVAQAGGWRLSQEEIDSRKASWNDAAPI